MKEENEYPEIIELSEINETTPSSKEEYSVKSKTESDFSGQNSHTSLTLQPLSLFEEQITKIKDFVVPDQILLKEKLVFLGPKTKKFTLILDLDLTLAAAEIVKTKLKSSISAEYSLKINVRPYAIELLQSMSEYYEIVIFTAACEEYAEEIVKELDFERKYIKKVISRKNCLEIKEGFVIKDLRIFADRDLKDILIVDDSVYSFAFHIKNGIPVNPYKEDSGKDDKELLFLINYLKQIYEENPENLVEANSKKLWPGLSTFVQYKAN